MPAATLCFARSAAPTTTSAASPVLLITILIYILIFLFYSHAWSRSRHIEVFLSFFDEVARYSWGSSISSLETAPPIASYSLFIFLSPLHYDLIVPFSDCFSVELSRVSRRVLSLFLSSSVRVFLFRPLAIVFLFISTPFKLEIQILTDMAVSRSRRVPLEIVQVVQVNSSLNRRGWRNRIFRARRASIDRLPHLCLSFSSNFDTKSDIISHFRRF